MEIHQIRYFLTLSRTLNFTRAAEECNVSQPALTRAIQALEGELGGDLIRRERNTSHLTELGSRMLPLLQRCYESALGAKELARAISSPEAATIRIFLAQTVGVGVVMASIVSLFERFQKLQLRVLHGDGPALLHALKHGEADIAVAGPLSGSWDRLDDWPLYEEGFDALVSFEDPLSNRMEIDRDALAGRRLLTLIGCECEMSIRAWLAGDAREADIHEATTQDDLAALVEAGVGIAFAPEGEVRRERLHRLKLREFDVRRTVSAYTVAGRQRPPAVNAFLSLLRAGAATPVLG